MAPPVVEAVFDIGHWRSVVASEAASPARRYRIPEDDLVQEALAKLWREQDRWGWPPEPARLGRFLYRLAREMTATARREARRRKRPPRQRRSRQAPLLCKRLRYLLSRVRKPWQYEDGVLSAAMGIAPRILRKGRFRECDLAWRQRETLDAVSLNVNVANVRIVQKRLARAAEAIESALLDAIRSILPVSAQHGLDVYRSGVPLADPELNALAEDVACALERLR